jgi:hypothetical protein
MIDEGCRFRIGKIMSVGTGSGAKARDLVSFFQVQRQNLENPTR